MFKMIHLIGIAWDGMLGRLHDWILQWKFECIWEDFGAGSNKWQNEEISKDGYMQQKQVTSPLSNNRVGKNGSKILKDVKVTQWEMGKQWCALMNWVEQFI
jgi:hypothetical protein